MSIFYPKIFKQENTTCVSQGCHSGIGSSPNQELILQWWHVGVEAKPHHKYNYKAVRMKREREIEREGMRWEGRERERENLLSFEDTEYKIILSRILSNWPYEPFVCFCMRGAKKTKKNRYGEFIEFSKQVILLMFVP